MEPATTGEAMSMTLIDGEDRFTFGPVIDLMPVEVGGGLSLVPSTPRYRLRRMLADALRPPSDTMTVTKVDTVNGVITIGRP